jgi:hypothetical protein
MPRYVIERQYLVPVYEHILVEASSFEAACRKAVDDIEEPWGDNAKTDYESARPTTIERAVELPEQVQASDVDGHSLSYFLYEAGLDSVSISREVDGPVVSIGFV